MREVVLDGRLAKLRRANAPPYISSETDLVSRQQIVGGFNHRAARLRVIRELDVILAQASAVFIAGAQPGRFLSSA